MVSRSWPNVNPPVRRLTRDRRSTGWALRRRLTGVLCAILGPANLEEGRCLVLMPDPEKRITDVLLACGPGSNAVLAAQASETGFIPWRDQGNPEAASRLGRVEMALPSCRMGTIERSGNAPAGSFLEISQDGPEDGGHQCWPAWQKWAQALMSGTGREPAWRGVLAVMSARRWKRQLVSQRPAGTDVAAADWLMLLGAVIRGWFAARLPDVNQHIAQAQAALTAGGRVAGPRRSVATPVKRKIRPTSYCR